MNTRQAEIKRSLAVGVPGDAVWPLGVVLEPAEPVGLRANKFDADRARSPGAKIGLEKCRDSHRVVQGRSGLVSSRLV